MTAKITLIFTALILCFTFSLQAQCPTEITFTSQAQVDSFPILYPNCTAIDELLEIDGDDITSLASLQQLESICFLWIEFSHRLKSLDGLQGLTSVGSLNLNVNDSLETLTGLENLTTIQGPFRMNNNHRLQNLHALQNLTHVGGIDFVGQSELKNLVGLEGLTEVGGLFISNNYSLENYNGLNNLKKVIGSFHLTGNYAEDFDAFSNLDSVNLGFTITYHNFLTNLNGFQNLEFIGGWVTIRNNNNLSNCAAFAICQAIAAQPDQILISDNDPGCNSPDELSGECLLLGDFSASSGTAYLDLNCDQLVDSTDVRLKNHMIRRADTQFPFAHTDQSGQFSNLIGTPSTNYFSADPVFGFTSTPLIDTVENDIQIQVFTDRNFGFCADSIFHNLKVNVVSNLPPRPGFQHEYSIFIENRGVMPENATLLFEFEDSIDFIDEFSAINFPAQINGNELTASISDLPIFEPVVWKVTVTLSPTAPFPGELVGTVQLVLPNGLTDAEPDNNIVFINQTIVSSYDPNDKTVNPQHINFEETADGNWLDYLIRFQNTGTYPATFVEVLDTISEQLDLRTLEMTAASHDYVLSFPDDQVLKWRFDNINLADSTSNEPESHGFISFRIKSKPGLPLDTEIKNRAGIYFDFNPVVLTEYAQTDFFIINSLEPLQQEAMSIKVLPNPISMGEALQVELESDFLGNIRIETFSIDGKNSHTFFQEKTAVKQVFHIRETLPAGQYLLRITGNEEGTSGLTATTLYIIK